MDSSTVVGFSYWYNGTELQTSAIAIGEEEVAEGYNEMCNYWNDGNTIASWWEGTLLDTILRWEQYDEVLGQLPAITHSTK